MNFLISSLGATPDFIGETFVFLNHVKQYTIALCFKDA